MTQIKSILKKLTAELVDAWGSTYEINNGGCEEWAGGAFDRLKDIAEVEVWATPYFFAATTHSFIRVNGLFYDAECLNGVKDHNDLPVFDRLIKLGHGRQPVWCEDSNHDITNSIRDISNELAAEIRQEQINSGVSPEKALRI